MVLTGPPETNELTSRIIQAGIEVHSYLGPGLLESPYLECLAFELRARGLQFERQQKLPIVYKGVRLEYGFRLDLVVEDLVVVEVKAVAEILEVHRCQLLTYLRFSGRRVGLILNFNVPLLRDGIARVVNDGPGRSCQIAGELTEEKIATEARSHGAPRWSGAGSRPGGPAGGEG